MKFMLFDMREYCDDCCAVYTKITCVTKFRNAVTPFLSDSAFRKEDHDVKGQRFCPTVHSARKIMMSKVS